MAISTSDGKYFEDEFDLVRNTEPAARITVRPPNVSPQMGSEEKPSVQDLGV